MNKDNIDIEELMAKALGELLDDDEGIVIHYNGEVLALYKKSIDQSINVQPFEDTDAPHGAPIWMHYEGSTAPDPDFEDEIIGDNPLLH